MFEDSLIESSGQIKTKKGATVVVSTVIHVGLIVFLLLLPLLSIDAALPTAQLMTFLVAPPPPPPPPPPAVEVAPAQPMVVKQVQIDPGAMVAPTEIPKD